MQTFFIAPTDFGVGLTSISLGLVRTLERAGLKAEIYPQIGSGPHGSVTIEANRIDPQHAMIWLEALDQAGISLTSLRIVSYEDGALRLTASTLSKQSSGA